MPKPKRNTGHKFSQDHEEWLKANVPVKKKFSWEPRGDRQKQAKENINTFDMNFFIGSAGGGKSWCSIMEGLILLEKNIVDTMILTKPMVEVGPSIGYLPGERGEKFDPYLESMDELLQNYDWYNDLKTSGKLKSEILGFIRGKTLNRSIIIGDEMQNSTPSQIVALMTRLGDGSKLILNGDFMQTDLVLKPGQKNGLAYAMELLEGHPDIGVVEFLEEDVQRHPLVRDVVRAVKAGRSLWKT